MAAINEHTGKEIKTAHNSKEFEDGHARIFGDKSYAKRGRYIQDPVTHKLVSADEYYQSADVSNQAPAILGDYKPYKSMVTGEMIDGRRAHREHLLRHNVVVAEGAETKQRAPIVDKTLKQDIARLVYEKLR